MRLESRTCPVSMASYAKQCDDEIRDISDDSAAPAKNTISEVDFLVDENAKEDRRYLLVYGIRPGDEKERRFLRFYDHVDNCEHYFGIKLGQNQKKVALLEVLCTAYNIFEGHLVEHISFLCQLFSMETILLARDAVSIIVGRRGGKTFAQCVVAACWLVTQPGAHNIAFFTISKRAATDASNQIRTRLDYYAINHPESRLILTTQNVEKITARNQYTAETEHISVTCYPGLSNEGKIEYCLTWVRMFPLLPCLESASDKPTALRPRANYFTNIFIHCRLCHEFHPHWCYHRRLPQDGDD